MKKLVLIAVAGIAVAGGLYTIGGKRQNSIESGTEDISEAQVDSEAGGTRSAAAPNAGKRTLTKPVTVPPTRTGANTSIGNREELRAEDTTDSAAQLNAIESLGSEPTSTEAAIESAEGAAGEPVKQITFEMPNGTSHQEFAAAYESYIPANVQMPFMRTLSGEYLGTTANDTDEYELRFEVDGAIEGSEYVGKSLISIVQNGQQMARMTGDWLSEFFKVNDEGELVFTDIGGLEEEDGKTIKYHIIKMNFSDKSAPPFTLSYFDGTRIKNLGSGVLVKQ